MAMEISEANKRPGSSLPPISMLDDKYNRNESAPPGAAPFPPPPPFSLAASSASTASSVPPGLISPPGSRRTSGDEKDQRQAPRQSLPSIHEALGAADQPMSYPVQPPPPTSSYYPPQQTQSPPDSGRRQFPPDPPPPPSMNNGYAPHTTSPFSHRTAPVPPPPPPGLSQPEQVSRPSIPSIAPPSGAKLPSLHPLQTGPVEAPRYQYSQQPSPAFEAPPQSAQPMQQPFGYTQYQSQHPLSAPPTSAPQGTFPSTAYTDPRRYPQQAWRPDGPDPNRIEEGRKPARVSGPAYGESVKRHLEHFDFEGSLNEIADHNGRMSDFANHYRRIAHQTQRTGLTPTSAPKIDEVDEMLARSESLQQALLRIKDVVLAQNASANEQAAQDQRYKLQNGYQPEEHNPYQDDTKSAGFAGADPKKRRGRAAPPGRCHSCNRAETPEWRRGPDGARTLCNACGLHYAKLTRKMGTNKAAVGGSNLRPKGPGSPIAQ